MTNIINMYFDYITIRDIIQVEGEDNMIICLCGKSGCGKSTVANEIMKNNPNSIHVDIDKIGHNSHSDEKVKKELIIIFGNQILTNNTIDRKKLGKIVFQDKEEMKKLEDITWNYMEKQIDKIINNNKDKLIILDWQLLPKTKYFNDSNLKILIDVPYEIRKQRTLMRDNITEEQFNLRESASINYDKSKFDFVVSDNNEIIKKKVFKYE